MRKIENVIQEKNIQWVYGSHNAILPDIDMVFETTAFFEDVMDEELDYSVEDWMLVYELNAIISLCLSQD